MAHYTLARLSDVLDHVHVRVIVCTKESLDGAMIKTIDELPECEMIDAKTGEKLSESDLKEMKGFEIWRTLNCDAKKAFFKAMEEHHRQKVAEAKEFLGL